MITYKTANETGVYISDAGYLCLIQKDELRCEEQLICLTPDQVCWLISTAEKLLPHVEAAFSLTDEDDEDAIEA